MKSWIKGFLILYLLLTIFQNMAASEKYEKYLKIFSGFLLLLYIITPLWRLHGQDLPKQLETGYFWQQLESIRQESSYFETVQSKTAVQKYEQALSVEAAELLEGRGWPAKRIEITLDGQYQIREIKVKFAVDQREFQIAKSQAAQILQEQYQLQPEQILIENERA